MAEIHLDDLQHVVIDGEMVGDLVSAIANYTSQATAIAGAAVQWVQAQEADHQKAIETLQEQAQKAGLVEGLEQQVSSLTIERDANAADNALLRKQLVNYLQATDGGQQVLKAYRVMILEANKAAIESELTGLLGA